MSIESRIKEIKKYFPVMKRDRFTDSYIRVYRGNKSIELMIFDKGIYLDGIKINIKKLSKNFTDIFYIKDTVHRSVENINTLRNESIEELYFVLDEFLTNAVGN